MQVHEAFLPIDEGLRLRYCLIGDGTDPVIIPAASWLLADWEPLAHHRTLLFYDSRGRGGSDSVTDPAQISLANEVRDAEFPNAL
jgi:hypothetical protein